MLSVDYTRTCPECKEPLGKFRISNWEELEKHKTISATFTFFREIGKVLYFCGCGNEARDEDMDFMEEYLEEHK